MVQQVMIDPCNRKDCNNPKRGSQFCVEHECTYKGCNNGPKKGEVLCGPHLAQAEKEYYEMANQQNIADQAATEHHDEHQLKNEMELEDLPTHNEQGKPIYYASLGGHRPKELGGFETNFNGKENANYDKDFDEEILAEMVAAINRAKDKFPGHEVRVITGMALGADQLWARAASIAKVKYYAFIPCYRHESRWTKVQQAKYRILCALAEGVIYTTKGAYDNLCMQVRNEHMVDYSNATVFVWNGKTSGGTWNCMVYAAKVKQPKVMIFIDSKAKKVIKDPAAVANCRRILDAELKAALA